MASITLRVHNLTKAAELVRQISAAGSAWGKVKLRAGSPLAYARGIETGKRRNGQTARKAGGAFMFKKGIEKIKPVVRAELGTAAMLGPMGISALVSKLSAQLVSFVQEETPVVSGNLRQSVFAGPE